MPEYIWERADLLYNNIAITYRGKSPSQLLDSWVFMTGKTVKIVDLSEIELKQILTQLESHEHVLGQDSKIVSIKKELASRPVRKARTRKPKGVETKTQSWRSRMFVPRRLRPKGGR